MNVKLLTIKIKKNNNIKAQKFEHKDINYHGEKNDNLKDKDNEDDEDDDNNDDINDNLKDQDNEDDDNDDDINDNLKDQDDEHEDDDDDINDNLKDQNDEHEDDDDGINDDLKDQDNKNEDDDDDEGVPCECVLLNPLPLCVLCKLSFSVRHGFVNHLYYLLTLEKYYHYYCNHSLNFLLILHFISQMLLSISLN